MQSYPRRGLVENVLDSRRAIWEEVLEGVGEPAYVLSGDLIFRPGSPPRIALIRAGIVRLYLSGTSGQQLTIRYGRQGDLVGLAPLLGGSRSWSAEAVVDTSVELLTMDHVRAVARRRPDLPWLIIATKAAFEARGHALCDRNNTRTTKTAAGSSLAQVCDERETFFLCRNATFVA